MIYINGNSDIIPAVDSVRNVVAKDVSGNRSDGHNINTLAGRAHRTDDHLHNITKLYPELAIPVVLTKAGGAYAAFGTPTEIIPAGTIGLDFDIHWAVVSAISANGDYILQLYQGAALSETVIATISVVRNAVQSQEGSMSMITPLLLANARISAAISSGNAAADTLATKLQFHTY